MSRAILLGIMLALAACGIKKPLMKPSEIPAYEQSLKKKRERLTQEQENAVGQPDPIVESEVAE